MRILLTFLLLCSIIFSNANAKDGELWMDMTIRSIHGQDTWTRDDGVEEDFNESNFGLGLVYGLSDYFDVTIGFVHENSYDEFSIYSAGNLKYPIFDTPDVFRLEPGIAFGLASGYGDTPNEDKTIGGDILPMVLPNISIILGDVFSARISYLPEVFDETTSMILIQGSVRFF